MFHLFKVTFWNLKWEFKYLLLWYLNLTGSSVMLRKRCMYGFCVSFPEEEIKAEAGLCVVIPCSFSTPSSFKPQNMVWFKCDASKSKCAESDIIFHLNRRKVQDGFKERVSLLEPDLRLENCSIIVNDLTESDSGSYQLRLNGLNYYGKQDGFTFAVRAFVSAKGRSLMSAAQKHFSHLNGTFVCIFLYSFQVESYNLSRWFAITKSVVLTE